MSDPLGTQSGTFKRMALDLVVGMQYLRAYWGQRWVGMIGLMSDLLAEGASQAAVAHLPGHPQQAPDSLDQSGADRNLIRFRGEDDATYVARVQEAWSDYAQAGTPQQLLHVLNQWGRAGWPDTWVDLTSVDESTYVTADTPFVFAVTIPFGNITPAWVPDLYGGSDVYGEAGLFYGIGQSSDVAMLVYLARKWRPSRCQGRIIVYYTATDTVTLIV